MRRPKWYTFKHGDKKKKEGKTNRRTSMVSEHLTIGKGESRLEKKKKETETDLKEERMKGSSSSNADAPCSTSRSKIYMYMTSAAPIRSSLDHLRQRLFPASFFLSVECIGFTHHRLLCRRPLRE